MLYMDIQADTVEKARKKAANVLKLSEEELSFEVLEKGKVAFLGFGKPVPALVRVFYKQVGSNGDEATTRKSGTEPSLEKERVPGENAKKDFHSSDAKQASINSKSWEKTPKAVTDVAKTGGRVISKSTSDDLDDEVWEQLLANVTSVVHFLDPNAQVESMPQDEERHKLLIKSANVSHIIGKQGKALAALQIVVNAILQKYENRFKIIVDVDYYNKKKDQQLLSWVNQQARKVVQDGRAIVLKSLNSYERRLVHLEMKNRDEIIIESKGEGKIKNMKLSPRK